MTQTLAAASGSVGDRTTGRVTLRNVSWRTYQALATEVGDGPTRLTYDRGLLEIEVPSRHHEQIKRFVGELIEISLRHAGIDYEPSGSATWQREAELQGLEADECYHVQNAQRVRGKVELDRGVDPPPDLVVEVDLTSSSIDKLEIYGSLGVPEVWRVRGDGRYEILLRGSEGTYHPTEASVAVAPVTARVLSEYVRLREQVGHSEAIRRFELDVLRKQ